MQTMSTTMPTPEQSSPSVFSHSEATSPFSREAPRPQRASACVLCQQRKVKCDRQSPCENCVRARAQCVPASMVPRQRRRRFPERELLERLRRYEGLLRQHKINFEPLHPRDVEKMALSDDGRRSNDANPEDPVARTDRQQSSRQKVVIKSETEYAAK